MSSVRQYFFATLCSSRFLSKGKKRTKTCETQTKRTRMGTNQREAVLLKRDEETEGTPVALFYWLPRV